MSRKYESKTLRVQGHDVQVEVEDVENDVPAVRVRAVVGDTEVVTTHTLGPVDGALVPPTLEQVQASIDQARERAAALAAHRHALKQHLDNVK